MTNLNESMNAVLKHKLDYKWNDFRCLSAKWGKLSFCNHWECCWNSECTSYLPSAPGQESEARMVLSYSGKVPHMAVPKKGGEEFSCDVQCSNWKAMGICSDTLAKKKLPHFLSHKKRKKEVNLTKLLTTSMPNSHRRKGARFILQLNQKIHLLSPVHLQLPLTVSDTFWTYCIISYSLPFLGSWICLHVVPSVQYGLITNKLPLPLSQHCIFTILPANIAWGPQYYQLSLLSILYFITKNIRVCIGCRNTYLPKNTKPLHDLCIRHEEWW